MAILRYRFPKGQFYGTETNKDDVFESLIKDGNYHFEKLTEGYYNVSPSHIPDYPFIHKLFVNRDGSARYTVALKEGVTARHAERVELVYNEETEVSSGLELNLPDDDDVTVVGRIIDNGESAEVFQFIFWVSE